MTKYLKLECPLCHVPSQPDRAFFPPYKFLSAYTNCLDIDPVRSLFYQPAFHWDCYLSWSHRDAFATGLFEYLIADCDRSTLDGRSYIDGDLAIFIPVNATSRKPFAFTLILRITGRSLIISTEEWIAWQNSPDTIAPQYPCHPVECQFLRDNLPRVWRLFPNVESLISQTDWSDTERKWYE